MKTRVLSILYCSFFILIIGCSSNQRNNDNLTKLTGAEQRLCDSLGFDKNIISDLRKYNTNAIEQFHYALPKVFENGKETEIANPIYLKGIEFKEENAKSMDLILKLKDGFKKRGYTIFLLENNFDINHNPDVVAVLKTTDKYEILKQIQTDGINYDITNDSLCSIIKQFDAKYSLELIGASGDWCEFEIKHEPSDWLGFAKDVYKICPDVVDQGTGTVEALAEEMKQTKTLYFWWD